MTHQPKCRKGGTVERGARSGGHEHQSPTSGGIPNSRSEIRDPKEIRKPNDEGRMKDRYVVRALQGYDEVQVGSLYSSLKSATGVSCLHRGVLRALGKAALKTPHCSRRFATGRGSMKTSVSPSDNFGSEGYKRAPLGRFSMQRIGNEGDMSFVSCIYVLSYCKIEGYESTWNGRRRGV